MTLIFFFPDERLEGGRGFSFALREKKKRGKRRRGVQPLVLRPCGYSEGGGGEGKKSDVQTSIIRGGKGGGKPERGVLNSFFFSGWQGRRV